MRKFCRGIISPLSLIVIGFLVASVYGGVKIAKDKNINLNIGSKAAPNYVACKVCRNPGKTNAKCVNNNQKDPKTQKKIACKSKLNTCDKDSECQGYFPQTEGKDCNNTMKCGDGLECVNGKCSAKADQNIPEANKKECSESGKDCTKSRCCKDINENCSSSDESSDAKKCVKIEKIKYCSRTCLGNFYCEPDINGGTCKIDIARSTTTPKPTSSPTPFSQYWNCEKDPNALGCKSPTPTPKGTPSVKCGGELEPGETICTNGSLKTCDQNGRLSFYTCPSGQCIRNACKPITLNPPAYPDEQGNLPPTSETDEQGNLPPTSETGKDTVPAEPENILQTILDAIASAGTGVIASLLKLLGGN